MKNLLKDTVKGMANGVGWTIGYFVGLVIWEKGLGTIVEDKAKKVFSKKEES